MEQTKSAEIQQVFNKKGKPIQNLLAANLDSFGELLVSLRTNLPVEDFFGKALREGLELKRDLFRFSDAGLRWLFGLALFDSAHCFSAKVVLQRSCSSGCSLPSNGSI